MSKADPNLTEQVTPEELMGALFPRDLLEDGEFPLLGSMHEKASGGYGTRVWRYHPRALTGATHAVTATMGDMPSPSNAAMPFRSPKNFKAAWFIQLDDIGTVEGKSTKPPRLKPSVMIETSPGNYTYLYLLKEPIEDVLRYEQITKSLRDAGHGDPNCWDVARFFRLPGSVPPPKTFAARLSREDFHPERLFDADTLLHDLGVAEKTFEELRLGDHGGIDAMPAPPGVEVHDAVLEWMDARGMVQDYEADGWVKIDCPWTQCHSDNRPTAKYKPATEEDIKRVFWCWHTHGQQDGPWGHAHKIKDLLAWVVEQGGPHAEQIENVRPVNALAAALGGFTLGAQSFPQPNQAIPRDREAQRAEARDGLMDELMGRYVWFTPKGQIFDLHGADTFPLMTERGVCGKWAAHRVPSVTPAGNETTVNIVTHWIGQDDKMETQMLPRLDPRYRPGWTGEFINTWRPFETEEKPNPVGATMFDALVRHVFPNHASYALDWMAHKLQHPEKRMVALVNYTPIFGTGRGTVMQIMARLVGNSSHVEASSAFGKNANQFNAHLNALLVCIHEVAEGADDSHASRISKATYERLKELCDPDRREYRLERKGVDAEMVMTFSSYLIATNAADGLPLEAGDRRFSVERGNMTPLRDALPDVIAWLKDGGSEDPAMLAGIEDMLMRRDVSAFEPSVPMVSDAKTDMVEAGKSAMDLLFEEITEPFEEVTAEGIAKMAYRLDSTARQYGEGRVKGMVTAWLKKNAHKPEGNQKGRVKLKGVNYSAWMMRPGEHEGVLLADFLDGVNRVETGKGLTPSHLKVVRSKGDPSDGEPEA